MKTTKKVAIVPCSGIGKPYGTVSRVAAYQVTEQDHPEDTQLIPLALLVLGDENYQQMLNEMPAITIDGCKLACATKMVQQSGGKVANDFAVMDVFRRYRQFKPQGIAQLNEEGEKLADALAQEIDQAVDQLTQEGENHA
ncbi:MAG: putative zinc-binding protein [Anaerolineaceae bacterium]